MNSVVKNIVFDRPLFPKSALNRMANTTPSPPYSLILANKGIRENNTEITTAIKGTFQNKGLRHPAALHPHLAMDASFERCNDNNIMYFCSFNFYKVVKND